MLEVRHGPCVYQWQRLLLIWSALANWRTFEEPRGLIQRTQEDPREASATARLERQDHESFPVVESGLFIQYFNREFQDTCKKEC